MNDPRSIRSHDRTKAFTGAIVGAWFLLALSASWFGAFDSPQRPPLLLGAAALAPVVAFAVWYLRSPAFRHFVLGANLRLITLAHTWRVAGVAFLILQARGVLPGVFAYPAGWGDIAIGATAPLIAGAISPGRDFPRNLFVVWNLLGILDLVVAVSLGILASASPLGILAGDTTTRAMGAFPLSLVPTFFVPLFVILHLTALANVAQRQELRAHAIVMH